MTVGIIQIEHLFVHLDQMTHIVILFNPYNVYLDILVNHDIIVVQEEPIPKEYTEYNTPVTMAVWFTLCIHAFGPSKAIHSTYIQYP